MYPSIYIPIALVVLLLTLFKGRCFNCKKVWHFRRLVFTKTTKGPKTLQYYRATVPKIGEYIFYDITYIFGINFFKIFQADEARKCLNEMGLEHPLPFQSSTASTANQFP